MINYKIVFPAIFLPAIILFCLLQVNCGPKNKIDVSSIEIDDELSVQHDGDQKIDSIEIVFAGYVIKNTGDSVYRIITHKEKRRIDSLRNYEKRTGIPINPFSPGPSDRTHQSFTLTENSHFSIIAYDTTGNEVIKFINDKFPKGIYEVYYAIYSILKPSSYYLIMSSQMVEQYIKLKVN